MKNKKIYLSIIGILLVAIIVCGVLLVLPEVTKKEKKQSNLSNYTINNNLIYLGEEGTPSFIDGYDYTIKSEDDISDFLYELSDMYGFSNNPKNEFKILETTENDGIKYYRLQQQYNGIQVYGHQLIIGTKDDKVDSVSGHYQKDVKVSTYKTLSDDDIKEIISNKYSDYDILSTVKNIYIKDGKAYYVYITTICTENSCFKLFIDVDKKEIINKESITSGAKETYKYTGKDIKGNEITLDIAKESILGETSYYFENLNYGYRVIDGVYLEMNLGSELKPKLYNIIKFYETANNESKEAMKLKMIGDKLVYDRGVGSFIEDDPIIADAVTIMNNLNKVYAFYEKLGRKSTDGNGAKIRIFIDVDGNRHIFSETDEYNNASFIKGYNLIVIGKYNGVTFGAALDIIGHEFTHGVVSEICALEYHGQSGALDESYADIMGNIIEGRDMDSLGEDLGETFRSMANPGRYEQPSIYGEEFYFPNDENYYNSLWQLNLIERLYEIGAPVDNWKDYDNGGVHINSGVPNYAAYLAYTNGAYKDTNEMARVYYNSLFMLSPNATFTDSAIAVLKSARRLGLADDKIEIIRDAFIKTKMLGSVTVKVTGKVVDEKGNPLSNVEVKAAYKTNTAAYYLTYTDKDGNYTFNELPQTDYVFMYDKGKYASKEVENTIKEDSTLEDVTLTMIDQKQGRAEIVFVMDISASMTDNDPKDLRKKMISSIISELDDNNYLALVTFAKTGYVNKDGINHYVNNKNIITDVFNITNDDGWSDNSGTNGKAGLTKALKLFTDHNTRKYIIFFTDGEDNRDMPDDLSYSQIIEKAKEKGIRIISVGLGTELSIDTLSKLAEETGGKYFNATYFNRLVIYTKKIYDEIK